MDYSRRDDPEIPAGGFKGAGCGRENAPGGRDDLSDSQSVLRDPHGASENCDTP
jgi:hypothetical protein